MGTITYYLRCNNCGKETTTVEGINDKGRYDIKCSSCNTIMSVVPGKRTGTEKIYGFSSENNFMGTDYRIPDDGID